jgi:hypothetical protein
MSYSRHCLELVHTKICLHTCSNNKNVNAIRFWRRLKFGERSDLRNGSEREDGQAQDGIQRQNVLFLQQDVQDDF